MIKEKIHDIELENAIIGIMLLEPDSQQICFNYFRNNFNVFYDSDNETLYKTMLQMNIEGAFIDIISVGAKMKINGDKSTSGDNWNIIITKKSINVTSSAHIHTWSMSLLEIYALRKKQEITHRIIASNLDAFDAQKILNDEMDKIMSFKTADLWLDSSQIMSELLDRRNNLMSGKIKPIPTGLTDVDVLLGGGLDVGFHIIGARPAMGKSAICLSIVKNMAYDGNHVTLINLEMPISQLSARFVSMGTGVNFNKIYKSKHITHDEEKAIFNQMKEMSALPISFSRAVRFNKEDIRFALKSAKNKFNTKCVFIDYLQLIEIKSEKGKHRYELLGELSRELKLLSTELEIPIVALAQVNRESEGSDKRSKIAKISQLRESGNLEQDMDTGMIIDRPYKRGELVDENGEDTKTKAFLDVQKNRNGEERSIELYFDNEKMLFSNKINGGNFVNTPF